MELFRQRKVNIKVTITGEEKNSEKNEMSFDVNILTDSALKNLQDEFYGVAYRKNENKKTVDENVNKGIHHDDDMAIEDIPF